MTDAQANVHLIETIVSHRKVSFKSRNCVPHNLTYIINKSLSVSLACMKIAHLNPGSAVNKADVIQDCIINHALDVLALSETWFKSSHDASVINSVTPDGYTIHHQTHALGKVGGVAIIYKLSTTTNPNRSDSYSSFEYTYVTIAHSGHSLSLIVIYRSPGISVSNFLRDVSHLIDHLNLCGVKLLIMGDFTIHIDVTNRRNAALFLDSLYASMLPNPHMFMTIHWI